MQKTLKKKNHLQIILVMILCTINYLQVSAQPPDSVIVESNLEINGLIIDETMTKLGRDFYELFYSKWQAPPSSQDYTLYIKEQLQPGRATRITVMLNENVLMNQMLQPRREVLLALASKAVQIVQYQLFNYEKMIQALESEDQYGTGIY